MQIHEEGSIGGSIGGRLESLLGVVQGSDFLDFHFCWGIAGNWKYRISSRRIDSREGGAIGACGCLHCINTRSRGISSIGYDMEVVAVSQE